MKRRLRLSILLIAISVMVIVADVVSNQHFPPPLPLPACTESEINTAFNALTEYQPTGLTGFVQLGDHRFMLNDVPYLVRGVNYYPSRYPWRRFLTESDLDSVLDELALLEATGFNTLRLFLWNDALFTCPGSGAVPNAAAFTRLDSIIHIAANYDLRLIVTLNDMPDLNDYALYDNPLHTQQQTAFIVGRYRDESAILAWDLRNEGDIDYGSRQVIGDGDFDREEVLDWLAATSASVRALDNNHLVTAGWLHEAQDTAPYVDFLSFHHWWDADNMRRRIFEIRSHSDKPILLQEFGYSTQRVLLDEQAREIEGVIAATIAEDLLGWMIWTAFDFPVDATCYPSPCLSPDNQEHYFGLWDADYVPKPSVTVITDLIAATPS